MTMTLFYVIMSFTVIAGLVYCARRRTAIRQGQGSCPTTISFSFAFSCYVNHPYLAGAWSAALAAV